MNYGRQLEVRIRQEAASQGIEKTIQAVEGALGTIFQRGSFPSESRDIMAEVLRSEFGPKKQSPQ